MLKCWISKNKSHKNQLQKKFLSKLMIRRKSKENLLYVPIQPFIFTLSFPFCESQSEKEQRKKSIKFSIWCAECCMWVLVHCSAMHSISMWWSILSMCLISPWLISYFKICDYILTSSNEWTYHLKCHSCLNRNVS